MLTTSTDNLTLWLSPESHGMVVTWWIVGCLRSAKYYYFMRYAEGCCPFKIQFILYHPKLTIIYSSQRNTIFYFICQYDDMINEFIGYLCVIVPNIGFITFYVC